MKTTQYLLIIVLILSIFANVWLFLSLGLNQILWEDDYAQNDIEWCENTNDWIDLTNDLVLELQYYDSIYDNIEYVDQVDCWGDDGEEID